MPAVVSVFLAAQLAVIPITQVLAQAGQQESPATITDSTRTVVPPITTIYQVGNAARARLGVPAVEPNSPVALLLAPGSLGLTPAPDSLPVLEPTPLSTPAKVGIIVGAVLVVGLLVAVAFLCSGEELC